jgi:hypothetical protein
MSEIYKALADAAGQIGALNKTEKNKEQGFMFRSIDSIVAAAKPVFSSLSISVTPRLLEKDYAEVVSKSGARGWRCTVTMEYTFAAKDGSLVVTSMGGEAIDYGDKSTTKAEQMAFKYALTQVLLIGSGEDADADTHTLDEVVREPTQAEVGFGWLAEEGKIFKAWSVKERKMAYQSAMEYLGIVALTSMDEAKRIFKNMEAQYAERPIEQPTLEGNA